MTRPSSPGPSEDADPAVVPDLDPETEANLRRLREVSHLLDDSIRIPGTDYRIGVEPLVGLLPVVGDALGAAVSVYVLGVAARAGVPRATLARIAFVLGIDAVVGAVPLVGDVFDAYWKANLRSVRLLDSRLADPGAAAADRRYLLTVGVATLVVVALVVAGGVAAVRWALGAV